MRWAPPCNESWLNDNNVITIMIKILLYFGDAARKRSYLVFVLQCSKLFAPETLKESSTSQQNFFWSCSLPLPLCSVDMQKWTILTGKNYILKKKKLNKKKEEQNSKLYVKKKATWKRATFKHKIVHATWCKKRTTDNRRQPSTFYQAQCETVHQITKQKSFLEKNKDLRTAYKK